MIDNNQTDRYGDEMRETTKDFPAGSMVAWLLIGWTIALFWGLA